MRHLMTSFLALHWALFFALLAYLCIDDGVEAALRMLGANGLSGLLPENVGAGALALVFAMIAVLFLWALIEACLGTGNGDGSGLDITRIAFVAACAVFSAIALVCAMKGARALPGIVVYFPALLACYLAVLGERWFALRREPSPAAKAADVGGMARSAANTALLGRISGRTGLGKGR